ncbi:uncharacterized protein LOC133199394 [Saccostrea echinata]|uniref:uncharacterized protein LOC133199394 n=1 Tax=Saccostrea echinata TaxID=191078 RepID=UPI002A82F164|nr:uncharacterized protein LOC133199394 [Saccostrea echinata]
MENDEPVCLATDVLQAHERLHLNLKRSHRHTDVFQKSVDTLDNLRDIKGVLDGSARNFDCPGVCEDHLLELRQQVLMHVPSSVSPENRQKFQDLIGKTFQGLEVLSAVLVTCPWYQASQDERGEQARHNVLFIVYLSLDHQFLAPVNQHVLNEKFVLDKGWLYAIELYHFVYAIVKGRTRCVEVLYCPDSAQLIQKDQWKQLRDQLNFSQVTKLRGYVEACKGQSVSGIGKKGKDGKFRLVESTTFHQFCNSFRLMNHLYNISADLPPCTDPSQLLSLPDIAVRGKKLLYSLYKDPDVSKRDVFDLLVQWRDSVISGLKNLQYTNQQEMEEIIGKWQIETRLKGRKISVPKVLPDEHSSLTTQMQEIGGQVAKLQPEQIILIAQAGSHMYGLATPTSDVDFLVIYSEPCENVLGRCKEIKDNFESRGPSKLLEYGAYEARLFCEMLLKGSVVILELVFGENHNYMSSLWKELVNKRKSFLSEKGIQQYLGLIQNNLKMLERDKNGGASKDRKLLYQIFHKSDAVERMMNGDVPKVRCSGELRDFIMKIRTKPLENDFDRDVLLTKAKQKVDELFTRLAARKTRLKENMDFNVMTDWLLNVRGLKCLSNI